MNDAESIEAESTASNGKAAVLKDETPTQDEVPKTVAPPKKILVSDIGGTKVKALASGHHEPRKLPSGPKFTPALLVESIRELAEGWEYEAISIGIPCLVGPNGPRSEPGNLGPGWVGFDFTAAFDVPVRIANDALMQALGSYEGGRMLFLGLGTGLGSAVIAHNVLLPLELGLLPWRDGQTLSDAVGREGLERVGKKKWRSIVAEITPSLMGSFSADYVVIGGGNAKLLKALPPGARLGHNLTAFRGGVRLWGLEDIQTLDANGGSLPVSAANAAEWRLV